MNKAHKGRTEDFEGLTFAEQAKSISADIINLERAVKAHARRGKEEGRDLQKVFVKCSGQIQRLLDRVDKLIK